MKCLLFFIGGGLFVSLMSYSTPTLYSCREEVKKLTAINDSLLTVAQEARESARQQVLTAQRQRETAVKDAEKQKLVAENAQEEALIQAERAVQASTEATRQTALASEYKKQLATCQKQN